MGTRFRGKGVSTSRLGTRKDGNKEDGNGSHAQLRGMSVSFYALGVGYHGLPSVAANCVALQWQDHHN